MSLIAFHRVLITTAILFCLSFALRQFTEFKAAGNSVSLIFSAAFGIAAAALMYYLAYLRDFLKMPAPGAGSGPKLAGAAPRQSKNGRGRLSTLAAQPESEITWNEDDGRDEQDIKT